jgi:hypothetical protein
MAAAVACSLFPPLRLMLDEDSGEGSLPPPMRLHIDEDALFSDEDSTASVPLSTTSTASTILICDEEMEESDRSSPPPSIDLTHDEEDQRPMVLLEEELQEYHDPKEDERFIKKVLDTNPTPSAFDQLSGFIPPKPKHGPGDEVWVPAEKHCMILVGCLRLGGPDLINGAPQIETPPAGCVPVGDGYRFRAQGPFTPGEMMNFYHNTEPIGRYLIRRGFPIINKSGSGSCTLAFRISDTKVAKVARFDRSVNLKEWHRHRRERNYDVLLFEAHPKCFAKTTYHWVTPQDTKFPSARQEIYIQELLEPVTRLNTDTPGWEARYANAKEIGEMIAKNPGIKFRQWGKTLDKRLVCYDYH